MSRSPERRRLPRASRAVIRAVIRSVGRRGMLLRSGFYNTGRIVVCTTCVV